MAQFDGKSYGTSSVTKGLARHRMAERDAAGPKKDGESAPGSKEGASNSQHDHGGEAGGHEVIQQVHSEHGPAHKVTVEHDGKNHAVTTHHEDGHMHKSSGHPTADHVHAHLGHAVGKGGEADQSEGAESEGESSLEAMGVGAEPQEA